ncbi:MAG: SoxR reducing system RseC family protein [[Actinobacillus] rossii]|nr:SoxR reducing system RseC family protein [[Actinobacillus] rossii]MDY5792835.1 SoxR reducing system RseC family protein [[Actinobacillus] rossii]
MLIERAVVIGYEAGKAIVKCQSKSACGGCAAKTACGSSVLSELTGQHHEHVFRITTITPVAIGQYVEIGLPERSLLQSVWLIYVLPLMAILVSTFIGNQFFNHELSIAAFIFLCTTATFLSVHFYTKKIQKKSAFQPILIRVLN